MHDTLTMRTARQRVHEYKSESDELLERHDEAMECRDCEAFLQLGIDAFGWLVRADAELRIAASEGDIEPDSALPALCKMWLLPCAFAEGWIAVQRQRGYEVENVEKFRECCEEMRTIVEFQEQPDQSLPAPLANLRDQAIQEFRDGQTAEFI